MSDEEKDKKPSKKVPPFILFKGPKLIELGYGHTIEEYGLHCLDLKIHFVLNDEDEDDEAGKWFIDLVDTETAPTTPPARPTPRRTRTSVKGRASVAASGTRTISSTRTARIAPIGSIRTPSASSTVRMRLFRRKSRTSGVTTVGPVTTTRLPNRNDRFHGQSSR